MAEGEGPQITYEFRKLNEIAGMDKDTVIDVIGVVKECKEAEEFTSKQGKQLVKREMAICDETNTQISVTFWGDKWKAVAVRRRKGRHLPLTRWGPAKSPDARSSCGASLGVFCAS